MTQRSNKQNRAYWKWQEEHADELLGAGVEFNTLVQGGINVPITKDSLHILFNAIAQEMYNCTSSELNTSQFIEVGDTLQRHIAERAGISVGFPSIERIFDEELMNK